MAPVDSTPESSLLLNQLDRPITLLNYDFVQKSCKHRGDGYRTEVSSLLGCGLLGMKIVLRIAGWAGSFPHQAVTLEVRVRPPSGTARNWWAMRP